MVWKWTYSGAPDLQGGQNGEWFWTLRTHKAAKMAGSLGCSGHESNGKLENCVRSTRMPRQAQVPWYPSQLIFVAKGHDENSMLR